MEKYILIASFFIAIVCVVKCAFSAKKQVSDLFLRATFLSLILTTVVFYVSKIDRLNDFPHLYRLGSLALFVFVPSSYLYVKYALSKTKLNRLDLVLYIPALIFLIDYLPFYFSSANAKVQMMQLEYDTYGALNYYMQSHFFPIRTYYIVQNTMGMVLGFYELYFINRLVKMGGKHYFSENKSVIIWLSMWGVLLIASAFPDFLNGVFGIQIDLSSYTYMAPCFFMYFLYPFSILINSELLYGTKGFWYKKNNMSQISLAGVETEEMVNDILMHSTSVLNDVKNNKIEPIQIIPKPTEKEYFNKEKAEELKMHLDQVIEANKLFVDKDLSIQKVAEISTINTIQIQSLLTEYIGMNFKDYIDAFRIRAFINKYGRGIYKFNELIEDNGFTNELEFSSAFKKITGVSAEKYFQ
jgi:AraC-like DNA-binding protein